ncbi:MAG TPA: hypothetical protein ENK94_01815, partial [Campylobacterales bacterium]|nr:hypothetical protein [Campylobacterales bacterium]
MKLLLVYLFIFAHLVYADKVSDANVTKELNSSTVFDSNVSNDDISVIEEALKQRKIEAEKRLQEEKRQKAILREQKRMEGKRRLRAKIDALVKAKEEIDDALKKDNIWASRYLSYESYKELKKKLEKIDDEILVFQSQNTLNEVQSRELTKLQDESKIIAGKIAQLDDYKSEPFREYNKAINLEDAPVVTNPLDILTAL